ncbi:MAG: glycosyltransferase [Bryobacterales bacterium]|nr:glycosyltransferase [Bryobacterales bacterium]
MTKDSPVPPIGSAMPAMPDAVVVMPAYNEAGCIEEVVRDWVAAVGRVVVVNDGSRDNTGEILDRLAAELPTLRVIHQANSGHGTALITGYRAALGMGVRWVFQTDSDGQFLASDFRLLWERREESEFLAGRRFQRDDHPVRIWLSKLHARILQMLFGVALADSNVPYRLMRASLLSRLLEKIPPGSFAPNVMLSVLAAREGHELAFIPVSHRARKTGVVSIRGWKTLQVGLLVFRQLLHFRRSLREEESRIASDRRIPTLKSSVASLPRAMRPMHWLKNGFVLAPLLYSRAFHEPAAVANAVWTFTAFCLLASASYLWNDYWDVAADRKHAAKQLRPLASGALAARLVLPFAGALLALSALVLLRVPEAIPYAAAYVGVNFLYSAGLKHFSWLDLLLLTAGYVLRVAAGAAAIHVQPTAWMLSATFALALYLASLKRYAELNLFGGDARAALARYRLRSLRWSAYLAGAAALACYVTFTTWVRPALLLTIPVVVAGMLRYGWLVLHRQGSDSPILLIGRDPWLILITASWLAGTIVALW